MQRKQQNENILLLIVLYVRAYIRHDVAIFILRYSKKFHIGFDSTLKNTLWSVMWTNKKEDKKCK